MIQAKILPRLRFDEIVPTALKAFLEFEAAFRCSPKASSDH